MSSGKTPLGPSKPFEAVSSGQYTENPPKSGLLHTILSQDSKGRFQPNFKKADNEKIVQNNGAYIVLGTDRPTSLTSGKGASGGDGAASIDLVVGRMDNMNPNAKKEVNWVDNSFSADSARIYIAQLTDVDSAFSLAPGLMGSDRDRSAIGIKADGVRIIGRAGIRLITGVSDGVTPKETLARDGSLKQPAPTIEFIAGNNTDNEIIWGGLFNPREELVKLQPIVKGWNLQDALLELVQIVEHQAGAISNLAYWLGISNNALSTWASTTWTGLPASVISALTSLKIMTDFHLPSYATRTAFMTYRGNYLIPGGRKFIGSYNVYTT